MESQSKAATPTRMSLMPDVGDILFITLLYLLLFSRPFYIFGDGGIGWHLSTGQYVLAHHDVPRHEFLSYTFKGKDWIVLYWLGDTLMALAAQFAGLNGVALLAAGTIALLALLLYQRLRATGCHMVIASIIIIVGEMASSAHWLARPHLATFAGVYIFSCTLEDYRRGTISSTKLITTLAIASLLWANLHPGFMCGWALIGIYLTVACALALFHPAATTRKTSIDQVKTMTIALAAAVGLSLVNPTGALMLQNLSGYLGQNKLTDFVDEYKSPIFHGDVQNTCLELMFLLLGLGLLVRRRAVSVPQALASLAFAHLALQSGRNIPLFVIVAAPFIAECFAPKTSIGDQAQAPIQLDLAPAARLWIRIQSEWTALGERMDVIEKQCQTHALSMVAFLVFFVAALNGGNILGIKLIKAGFDPDKFPTSTLNYIKDHHLPVERGFNEANWGGYISNVSGIAVFIDDRSALFGEPFYLAYASVINLAPGWQDYLKQHNIAWIIFPKNTPFAKQIQSDSHWKLADQDQAAYLFVPLPIKQAAQIDLLANVNV